MTNAVSITRSILMIHAGAEMYGADKILHIMANGLIERGWRVTVVIPWAGELKAALEVCGADVIVLNHGVLRRKYFNPCGLLNRAVKIVVTSRTLARIAHETGCSVVHTNTSVVFAGALTAKLAGLPHVWHIHEITTRPVAVWRVLSWLIPRLADRVVCVSQAVLAHLVAGDKANAVKGEVLYNGIAPMVAHDHEREHFRREIGLKQGELLVGMVGRVNAWKGQMVLIEAAEQVAARYRNVKFLFVGGTFAGEEHMMSTLIARAGVGVLAGRVVVLDFRKDIPAIMSALDIFVLPSTQPDPLPTVVLEAMSMGCPVVGFSHGGICEMVLHEETGLLVPPCEVNGLANAIEQLITNDETRIRYGAAGRKRFNDSFAVSTFLDRFEEVYEKTILG